MCVSECVDVCVSECVWVCVRMCVCVHVGAAMGISAYSPDGDGSYFLGSGSCRMDPTSLAGLRLSRPP